MAGFVTAASTVGVFYNGVAVETTTAAEAASPAANTGRSNQRMSAGLDHGFVGDVPEDRPCRTRWFNAQLFQRFHCHGM